LSHYLNLIEKEDKVVKSIFFSKNVILNQCMRLAETVNSFSNIRPVNEIKKSMGGLLSALGSIKSVEYWQKRIS
jgi:hypothetical protein